MMNQMVKEGIVNSKLEEAKRSGLIDNIKIWLRHTRFVSVSDLQRRFSLSFPLAVGIMDLLSEEGIVEKGVKPPYKVRSYNPFSDLKIYLVDSDPQMVAAWKKEFGKTENIEVVQTELAPFLADHPDIDCVVTTGSPLGQLDQNDGTSIVSFLGKEVEKEVRLYINEHCHGEQPLGTASVFDIRNKAKKLIYIPISRTPSRIKDPQIIYQAMRAALVEGLQSQVKSIVIPAFGGREGKVEDKKIARLMKEGYLQIHNHVLSYGL